jgi:uncharacterized protein
MDELSGTPLMRDEATSVSDTIQPDFPLVADIAATSGRTERSETQWQSFDPRNIDYERTGGWIATAVVGLIMVFGLTITGIATWPNWMVLGIAGGVCLLVLGFLVFLNIYIPPLSHSRAAWSCDARGFQMRKGIWWRKGPMQRSYGLAKLTIHTAGTQNSTVEVEGLNHEVAMQLRDILIEDRSFQDAV